MAMETFGNLLIGDTHRIDVVNDIIERIYRPVQTSSVLSTETDELLAGGTDLHTHSLLGSNLTTAGSSATKSALVILNGTGNTFHELTTTTGINPKTSLISDFSDSILEQLVHS